MPHPRARCHTVLILLAALAMVPTTHADHADDAEWKTVFTAAQVQAHNQGKHLLVYFGADWCPPCRNLNEQVLSQPDFLIEAQKHFVLVKIDFSDPKTQGKQIAEQNERLSGRYGISTIPTILLTDALGRPYATPPSYNGIHADTYSRQLLAMRGQAAEFTAALATAELSESLAKAKALGRAMDLVGKSTALAYYTDTVEQIIALDPDNKAGLKQRYAKAFADRKTRAALRVATNQFRAGQPESSFNTLARVKRQHKPTGESLQALLLLQGRARDKQGRRDEAVTLYKAALDAAPRSSEARTLKNLIKPQAN